MRPQEQESGDDGSLEDPDELWGKDKEQKEEHHEGQVSMLLVGATRARSVVTFVSCQLGRVPTTAPLERCFPQVGRACIVVLTSLYDSLS